ncbi:Elongator complex protein 5 [Aphelenchoides fujianensis]|nr:Elongator complex protein 5 [Aphelenchoides fujianensis]
MENLPLRGVTLVAEPPAGPNATPLLLATLKRLHALQFAILAVATFADRRELERWFRRAELTNVRSVDVPLGELERLVELVEADGNERAEKRVIFVSNADVLLRLLDVDRTARVLNRLAANHPLITRVFDGTCSAEDGRRLRSVCSNVLRLFVESGAAVCETTVKKKDGSFGRTLEEFTIDAATLTIRARAHQPAAVRQKADVEAAARGSGEDQQNALPRTTFDMGLNLSAEERRAKRATQLPYTQAQNEEGECSLLLNRTCLSAGLVALNIAAGRKVRAGGQIIYTPDRDDDLDDSDPDEDLMI